MDGIALTTKKGITMDLNNNKEEARPMTPSQPNMAGACGRMPARLVLEDKIKRARNEVHSLEIMHKVIPWDVLCAEDEEKLWDYFVRSHN